MTKISYSELMKELERYTPPKNGRRTFTKEQDKFLIAAVKKNMGTRIIKEWWERAGWTSISRETISRRLRELNESMK